VATIQSATGPIDTADLGFTLMHEHVRVGWPPMYQQYPEMFDREHELGRAVERLKIARDAGVRTIVDLTPIDLGRDVTLIAEAAHRSGMQIIAATGIYYTPYPFHFMMRPDDEISDLFIRDVNEGVSTTGVRAGAIKCSHGSRDAPHERACPPRRRPRPARHRGPYLHAHQRRAPHGARPAVHLQGGRRRPLPHGNRPFR
jgi:phosphotriesterase-related protein